MLLVSDIVSMEIFRGGVIFRAIYVFLSLKLVFSPEINSSLLCHGSPVIILWYCGSYARLLGTVCANMTCKFVFFFGLSVSSVVRGLLLPLEVIKCMQS